MVYESGQCCPLHHVAGKGSLVATGSFEGVELHVVFPGLRISGRVGRRQRRQGEPGGADATEVLGRPQQEQGIDGLGPREGGMQDEGSTDTDAHGADVVRIAGRTLWIPQGRQKDLKSFEVAVPMRRMNQERDLGGHDEEAAPSKGVDGLHDATVGDAAFGHTVHEEQLRILRIPREPGALEAKPAWIFDELHTGGDGAVVRWGALEGLQGADRPEARQNEDRGRPTHQEYQDEGPSEQSSSPAAHGREGTGAGGRRSTRYNAGMRTRHPAVLLSTAALAALAFGWSFLGETTRVSTAETPEIEFHKDVVYGNADGVELTLNLARPKGLKKPTATVALFHGGGWMRGNKTQLDRVARWLAERGFVAATIGYRLAPRHRWPAYIEDAKCSIRYLRSAAARWSIDPDRIGAVGFSAGAHLAMLLGTMDPADGLEGKGGHEGHPSKVNAVVSFFGPTDLDPETEDPRLNAFKRAIGAIMGPRFKEDPDAASPVTYVDNRDVPMLLFQGTRDVLVPHAQALTMLERLNTAGISAEVVFLVGRPHGLWKDPDFTDTVDRTLRFLDRQFRPTQIPSKWDAIVSTRK